MTAEEEELAKRLETCVSHFLWEYEALKDKNAELVGVIAEKNRQVAGLEEQVESLQRDYANLKTAKMLDVSSGEIRDAKSRLSRLVREVDKCIALLNV